jgi:hypothetical protein
MFKDPRLFPDGAARHRISGEKWREVSATRQR